MRLVLILLLIFPFPGHTQKVKINNYDKLTGQRKVELEPLTVLASDKASISIGYRATGASFNLLLSGYGWGSAIIDGGAEAVFSFSDNRKVTVKSTGLQTYEKGSLRNDYRHAYAVTLADLEALSRNDLVAIRKYSFKEYDDLKVSKENAAKIKKLSSLFIDELKKAKLIRSLSRIDPGDALQHIGDSVMVCSRVYNIRNYASAENGFTVLELAANNAAQPLDIIIPDSSRKAFNQSPEMLYNNRDVCIKGVIQLNNNIPRLIIHSRAQIDVTSAVSLKEVARFAGDSITVRGKIVGMSYLPNAPNSLLLLDLDFYYPDQPLTLAIDRSRVAGFEKDPEESFRNKDIEVSGRVGLLYDKPQMVIYNANQISIRNTGSGSLTAPPAYIANPESKDTSGVKGENGAVNTKTADSAVSARIETVKVNAGTGNPIVPASVEKPVPKLKDIAVPVRGNAPDSGTKRPAGTVKVVVEKENALPSSSAETKARFPGGPVAWSKFLQDNLKAGLSLRPGESKTVMVGFKISYKGEISNIMIIQSAEEPFDKEIVRILKLMPNWVPYTFNGKPNGISLSQQITFTGMAADEK